MADDAAGAITVVAKQAESGRLDPAAMDRALEDGLLIARSALTMDVKNEIIIGALRDGRPFDAAEAADAVTRELLMLANQNRESARRVEQLAADVLSEQGPAENSEGYQADDHPALANRVVIHDRLSEELERLSEDAEYVAAVAEQARKDAWAEVGDAIQSRLLSALPKAPDPFYEEDKDARIRALYAINLKALEKLARHRGVIP